MSTTKEELLSYFSNLSISTLQKLQKYSKLIIIPDEDLLTNATMTQMVDKAHDLADSLFPEWTDRSKSDFGEFLVELFALFSEKDFWYINAFANEGIFRKIRSYSNAYAKASTLGYYPTTCKGSSASFSILFKAGSAVTYERGELSVIVDGKEFSNDNSFEVEASGADTSKSVTLQQGKQLTEDIIYNGHSIFLSKKNIDLDSVSVIMDNVRFTRVRSFIDSSSSSPHFMLMPEADGACNIFFGNDTFGLQPQLGKSITVEYRTCEGADGNIPLDIVYVNDSIDSREALNATMLSDASGGANAETLASIKENAPMYFVNRGAAINEETAKALLNSFPFVYQSNVYTIGKEVYYQIIPNNGSAEPSDAEKTYMINNFEPCLILGYSGVHTTNNYVDFLGEIGSDAISVVLDVIVSVGSDVSLIEESVKQVLMDITNPLVSATYGQSFNKINTEIKMRNSAPGIQRVSFSYEKTDHTEDVIQDFVVAQNAIFRTIDSSDIKVRINAI